MSLVSIIMTTYNAELYLNEAIISVLNQTYSLFEFIIIDDGSTDSTVNIINSIHDDRIIFIPHEHGNYIDLLNEAINKAKGNYIIKMDNDDIMMPNRVEAQVNYMNQHLDIDISGTWAEAFGCKSFIIKTPITDIDIRSALLLQCPFVHPSVIIRKKSIDNYCKTNGECFYNRNYRFADDYKLWIDLAIAGWKFANIPSVLLKYRISNQQITVIHFDDCFNLAIKIQKEYMKTVMLEMLQSRTKIGNMVSDILDINKNNLLKFEDIKYLIYGLYRCYLISISR